MATDFFKISKGVTFRSLSTAPTSPVDGDVYYDSTLNTLRLRKGGNWVDLDKDTFENLFLSGFFQLDEITAPSTPPSGKVRVYAKSDGRLYIKDDTGLEQMVGAGSGAGEINVIGSPNDSINWGTSSATVATTSTASELPLAGVIPTALSVTSSTSGGYARYRWTMPVSLRQRKLKVEWHQIASSLASGAFRVEVWTNTASDYSGTYTEIPLSTDSSGDSLIPNADGKYTTTFDSADQLYYELRIVRTAASAATLYLANVIVGPGIQPSGYAGGAVSFSPTINGFGTTTDVRWDAVRQGSDLVVSGFFRAGTVAASTASFTLPTGLTLDSTRLTSTSVGQDIGRYSRVISGTAGDIYGSSPLAGVLFVDAGASTTTVYFAKQTGSNVFTQLNGSAVANSNDYLAVNFRIPIAEWAGSGTVNLGQNEVEYAAVEGTWDANSSAVVYGPQGAQMGGALTSWRVKTITWQRTPQPTDSFEVQISEDRVNWFRADGYISQSGLISVLNTLSTDGTFATSSGIWLRRGGALGANSTHVIFARYAFIANDDSPVGNWSSSFYWRVVKISGGQAVGFGLASATQSGLVSTTTQTLGAGVKTFPDGIKVKESGDGSDTITFYKEERLTLAVTGLSAALDIDVHVVRVGNLITLTIGGTGSVTKDGSAGAVTIDALPSWARPSGNITFTAAGNTLGIASGTGANTYSLSINAASGQTTVLCINTSMGTASFSAGAGVRWHTTTCAYYKY